MLHANWDRKKSVTFYARKVATKNTDIMQHLPNSWITTFPIRHEIQQRLRPPPGFHLIDSYKCLCWIISPTLWNNIYFLNLDFETRECKQWSSSPWDQHRPKPQFLQQINPIKITYPYPLRFHKVARLCFGSVFFKQFSSTRQSSSELQCVFHRVTLHAQAGTVRTKTAASDLETTAYFLGQLRDYVHLKSSEEGSQGEVEPRSCLFFVPIGPT